MPWFITAICSKDSMQRLAEKYKGLNAPMPSGHRTFGFYNLYAQAYKACATNECNMNECLYDYLVVEYIEEGIHPMVHTTDWWSWDNIHGRWINIGVDKTPHEFKNICSWALG